MDNISLMDEYIKNNPRDFKKFVIDQSIHEYIKNTCKNSELIKCFWKLSLKEMQQWNRIYLDFNRLNPSIAHMDKMLFDLLPGYEEYEFYIYEFNVSAFTAKNWVKGIDLEEI